MVHSGMHTVVHLHHKPFNEITDLAVAACQQIESGFQVISTAETESVITEQK